MKRLTIILGILTVFTTGAVNAGEPKKDNTKLAFQPLWRDGAPGAKGKEAADIPGVTVYLPAKDKANGTQVTKDTPPTFLVHTSGDTVVPPENSVLFYLALSKNKVPAELHIYEKGAHGLGLGPRDLPYSSWADSCVAWLRGQGFLRKKD